MEKNNETVESEIDEAKRDFMIKYGKFAATAPLGMYLLMGPGASKAQASGSCGRHGRHRGHGRHGGGGHGHHRGHGGRHGGRGNHGGHGHP